MMPFSSRINKFLAAIRVMPNVTRAAHAAKIDKSQHYAMLESCPEYAAEFQRSLKMGYDALSDIAVARATEGWVEPTIFQGGDEEDPSAGQAAMTVRRTDNQLLKFILERRHPEYRDRVEDSGTVDIHVMMENLNAARQRAADAKKARDAEDAEEAAVLAAPK
jgi:hypothetical protein